jgi:hypothetical protein
VVTVRTAGVKRAALSLTGAASARGANLDNILSQVRDRMMLWRWGRIKGGGRAEVLVQLKCRAKQLSIIGASSALLRLPLLFYRAVCRRKAPRSSTTTTNHFITRPTTSTSPQLGVPLGAEQCHKTVCSIHFISPSVKACFHDINQPRS